jgi:hypothetical protein
MSKNTMLQLAIIQMYCIASNNCSILIIYIKLIYILIIYIDLQIFKSILFCNASPVPVHIRLINDELFIFTYKRFFRW